MQLHFKKFSHMTLILVLLTALAIVLTFAGILRIALIDRRFVKEREIPALGMTITSQLDRMFLQYRMAGEDLLKDYFISDWILDGERDVESLQNFMEDARSQHGFLDTSLVSDISETYYGTDGRVLQLSRENEERDGWYYLYRENWINSNIDSWYYPETGLVGIYINLPVMDRSGNFLGVTGGGLDSLVFKTMLESFEKENNVKIYMMRIDGHIIYNTEEFLLEQPFKNIDEIWETPVLDSICREKNKISGFTQEPSGSKGSIIWSGYMREWDTYLVLERDPSQIEQTINNTILSSFAFGGLIILLVIIAFVILVLFLNKKTRELKINNQTLLNRTLAVAYGQNRLLQNMETLLIGKSNKLHQDLYIDLTGKEAMDLGIRLQSSRLTLRSVMSSIELKKDWENINLNNLIQAVLLKRTEAFSKKKVTIHQHIFKNISKIKGYEPLITLVLEEIFNGVYKATPEGSEILIICREDSSSVCIELIIPVNHIEQELFDTPLLQTLLEAMGSSLVVDKKEGNTFLCRLQFQPSTVNL